MKHTDTISRKSLAKVAIAFVLMVVSPLTTIAQNNKFKINDKLYPIYEKAERLRTTDEGMQLAKTLDRKAIELGDKKAQCLAYTIPVYYYDKQNDQKKFNEAVNNLKTVSRRNGYLQYYYFGYNRSIRYMQNHNQQLAAIDELKKMKNEALADKYPYGISTSYQMLGNIYYLRNDFDNAKVNYEQGLKYFKTYVKDQDPSVFYLMLTRLELRYKNYTAAMKYIEDGMKDTDSENNHTSLMVMKAELLNRLGKDTEFIKLMGTLDERMKKFPSSNPEGYLHLKVTQCIIEDKYEEARKWAEKIKNKEDRNLALRNIAAAKGDWPTAYQILLQTIEFIQKKTTEQQSGDIAEMNARFQNERLHSDMLAQQMENEQLMHERERARKEMELMELTNSNMEMRQLAMSDSIDRAKLIIDKTRLTMNSELAKKQVEVGKAQRENLEAENRSQRILFIAGSLVMLAIVANLAWNKRKSKRFIKELSAKNDELVVARDKAQQSEKIKTMFIQNVSHEIRTPLNAIVGFSNLLVDPNMETSQEEKTEFKNIISNNSELLTALVNDVLTLSELQSGKAGLNIATCKVNELCRIAIKTVEHRKPQDVELRFTTNVDDNFTVNSDARRINQVLINFLTNAEKYTTEGSITVDCSYAKAEKSITFSVTDTGCGIPKEKQQLIFERFEKLDDFHQGMGLGLNICAMIANILGARIGIDDTYTDGARFYFSLSVSS